MHAGNVDFEGMYCTKIMRRKSAKDELNKKNLLIFYVFMWRLFGLKIIGLKIVVFTMVSMLFDALPRLDSYTMTFKTEWELEAGNIDC